MRKLVGTATTRSGLTLLEAVLGLLLCVSLVVALQIYGLVAVMVAVYAGAVFLGFTVLWALAYLRAPDLTRNGTAIVILALLTLAWVPGRLLETREAARRHVTINNFRRLGQSIQGLRDAGRPGGFEQHYQQYLEFEEAEAAMRQEAEEETENR